MRGRVPERRNLSRARRELLVAVGLGLTWAGGCAWGPAAGRAAACSSCVVARDAGLGYTVRDGDQRLVWRRAAGSLEFYASARDFAAGKNRLAENAAEAAAMMRALQEYLEAEDRTKKPAPDFPRPPQDATEALKRMGYLAP